MIISRTPFRVSFFGGGTDYAAWYREHGGSVLSTTIDKYCYISCRYLPPFFTHKHRIVYSNIETVSDPRRIRHPSVRACMLHLNQERGIEIHHDGDLPARAGLGSSSAFTVGLIKALKGFNAELISKKELAKTAIHIEHELIKEVVGSQDQIATAYGGLNRILFHPDDSFSVHPVIMSKERKQEFGKNLMLVFTGFSRNAPKIAKTKIENFKKCGSELMRLGELVDQGMTILQSKTTPLEEFGKLLHESWQLKRSLSKSVSTPEIDAIYKAGMSAGAIGGKLLGAGGGGFMLFYVKPELQNRVRYRLRHLLHVAFRFDTSGSEIVLYDPQLE